MSDYTTPTFGWQVDYTSHSTSAPRVLTAAYGDGYQQRAGDGINTNPKQIPFTFTRDTETVNEVEAQLDVWGGVQAFFYINPTGTVARYVCQQYDVQYVDFNESTLTGTFLEVFEGSVPLLYDVVLGDSGLVE